MLSPCCNKTSYGFKCPIRQCTLFIFQSKATKSRTPDSKGKQTPSGRKVSPQKRSASESSPSSGKSRPGRGSSTPKASAVSRHGSSAEFKKTLEFGAGKSTPSAAQDDGNSLLWVDKYRPRSLKNLIGQQGEQSCANKLLRWLKSWHKNHSGNAKPAGECVCVSVCEHGYTIKRHALIRRARAFLKIRSVDGKIDGTLHYKNDRQPQP